MFTFVGFFITGWEVVVNNLGEIIGAISYGGWLR